MTKKPDRGIVFFMEPQKSHKAIIAIVKGGLGNQLFIYAAARAMALRMDRELYLDTIRGYTADSYERSYRLDRFPIEARTMPEKWKIAPNLRHPQHKLIRGINKYLPASLRSYIAERADTTPENLAKMRSLRNRITMLGYWQNEAYFADMAEKVRSELAVPPPQDPTLLKRGAELAESHSVFLHVRRTRYSPLLGHDYYQTAIDHARQVIREPEFILFGDEPSWAYERLDFGPCHAVIHPYKANDELTDLWLMTKCRHAIIANSTFSWWGAWLGGPPRATRMIWAPEQTGLPLVSVPGWRLLPASLTDGDKIAPLAKSAT